MAYMFETPATQAWKRLYDEGKLNRAQSQFWERRPAEELYDLSTDSDEVHNLAGSAAHQNTLQRLRQVQQDWTRDIRDVGFLPEGEIHSRARGSSPYDVGHSPARYPQARIMNAAEIASSLNPEVLSRLIAGLKDSDSAVRYWSALGFVMRGENAVNSHREPLRQSLKDQSTFVQIAAAEALGRFSHEASDTNDALDLLLRLASSETNEHYTALLALNALDALGSKAKPRLDAIRKLPVTDDRVRQTESDHCKRLLDAIVSNLA